MTRAVDVLRIARSRLGVVEAPAGSNRTSIGAEFGWNGVPWCAEFVWVVLHRAGLNVPKTASAPYLRELLVRDIGWRSVSKSTAVPGDVVFFDWQMGREIDHVGFVEGRRSGSLVTIEGNTTMPSGRVDGVARKVRSLVYVADVVRPRYTGGQRVVRPLLRRGEIGGWVRILQRKLGWVEVDGVFGPKTERRVRAFQRLNRLEVDGVVGPHTWGKLD